MNVLGRPLAHCTAHAAYEHDCPYCRDAELQVARWSDVKTDEALADTLRGAVDALATYGRHHDYCRSQRALGQGPCNCGYEAVRSAVFGGQYEQPATKDTTAVDALKRIRDHANSADDPAMIAQQALDQLDER